MKFLVDMNFGPAWTARLREHGLAAAHWTEFGDPQAADDVIVALARKRDCVIVTRDLDPARIVTLSGDNAPSVIQVRYSNTMLDSLPQRIAAATRAHAAELTHGAILVLDARTGRVRVRPLR